MCRSCVRKVLPDRGNFCTDGGVYHANYLHCHVCQKMNDLKKAKHHVEENDAEEEEENEFEEITTFDHVCSKCNHVIAEHWHSFRVVYDTPAAASTTQQGHEDQKHNTTTAAAAPDRDYTQFYMMECVLCGKGVDESKKHKSHTQGHHTHIHTHPAHDTASSSSSSSSTPLPEQAKPTISIAATAAQLKHLTMSQDHEKKQQQDNHNNNNNNNDDDWDT